MSINKRKVAIGGLGVLILIGLVSAFLIYSSEDKYREIGRNEVQRPNPWYEAGSVSEAEEKVGFEVEKFSYLPKGYDQLQVSFYTEEDGAVVREIAKNNSDKRIILEKRNDIIKEDGDFKEYTKQEKLMLGDKDITIQYEGEKLTKAKWDSNNYTYSIISDEEMEKEELIKIIEGLNI